METMRLFVAVPLPEARRREIEAFSQRLRRAGLEARWVPPDRLHLTLRFLGEVPDGDAARIAGALDRAVAGTAPFPVRFGELGGFPSLRRPRAVWLGIVSDPRLDGLYAGVARALAETGHRGGARPFRPHVTIGRIRPGARPGGDWRGAAEAGAGLVAEFELARVDLVRSMPSRGGHEHRLLHSAALARE